MLGLGSQDPGFSTLLRQTGSLYSWPKSERPQAQPWWDLLGWVRAYVTHDLPLRPARWLLGTRLLLSGPFKTQSVQWVGPLARQEPRQSRGAFSEFSPSLFPLTPKAARPGTYHPAEAGRKGAACQHLGHPVARSPEFHKDLAQPFVSSLIS